MVAGERICHSNARESLKIKISGAKVEVSAFVPEGVEKTYRLCGFQREQNNPDRKRNRNQWRNDSGVGD